MAVLQLNLGSVNRATVGPVVARGSVVRPVVVKDWYALAWDMEPK